MTQKVYLLFGEIVNGSSVDFEAAYKTLEDANDICEILNTHNSDDGLIRYYVLEEELL